jgi:cell division protein FtsL
MAAGAVVTTRQQFVGSSRRYAYSGTPEIYFPQAIDNSRLVKVADVKRRREMRNFAVALAVLFAFVMLYAWQHFSAIEYGYKIEAAKTQREALAESNRELRLELASLRDPERIDALARRMGLETPQVGQVVRIDPTDRDLGGPVMARASDVAVISTP